MTSPPPGDATMKPRYAAAVCAMVLVVCACDATGDPSSTGSTSTTTGVPATTQLVTTTTPVTTPATQTTTQTMLPSTTAPASACGSLDLGLDPAGTKPGPVAVCLGGPSGASFRDLGVVLDRAGLVDAEGAFAALAAGLDPAERQQGYTSFIPDAWPGQIVITRPAAGQLVVDFTDDIYSINGISTSDNSEIVLVQVFGTAYSDPTVASVTITVNGDPDGLCNLFGRTAGCGESSRTSFFE